MKEEKIRRLIKLLEESSISEIEVRGWGYRVRVSKCVPVSETTPVSVSPPVEGDGPLSPAPEDHVSTDRFHRIVSPMVGTFYRAPSPDAEPFIQKDQHVTTGQTVCIIEAMKLMNEIESDISGTVTEILVDDAAPVEYGQPLFFVRPD